MKIIENKILFRYIFVLIALVIAVASLIISHALTNDLKEEEHNKMKIWAEATKELAGSSESLSMNLILQILESNTTIPIILYDKNEDYYTSTNIELPATEEQIFLEQKKLRFSEKHEPIVIEIEGFEQYIFYDDSYTLKKLQLYPYVQLGILAIFVIISLIALLSTMRMEQDKLWVGLSKETAHQLGTPLSSLLAWIEYLKLKSADTNTLTDMEKDVNRLQMITDRFSKIGSKPVLEPKDIREVLNQTIDYLEKRMSKKVIFDRRLPNNAIITAINEPLMGWVIENLTKNAVDAMESIGTITYILVEDADSIVLDVIDTGKGIPKSKQKSVFSPGYSTKSRGWGLGLSLAKRIIESYHRGKIYVLDSEVGTGTTFRIKLKK